MRVPTPRGNDSARHAVSKDADVVRVNHLRSSPGSRREDASLQERHIVSGRYGSDAHSGCAQSHTKIPDTAMTSILPSGLDRARSDKKPFRKWCVQIPYRMGSIHVSDDLSTPPYFTIAFSMQPYGVIEGHMKSTICQNSRLDKSCLHIQFHRTAPPRCRPSRTTRRMPRESARRCHKKPAHRNPWPHRRTRTRQVARTRTATCRRRDRPARYP